jgi:hypothetical protein
MEGELFVWPGVARRPAQGVGRQGRERGERSATFVAASQVQFRRVLGTIHRVDGICLKALFVGNETRLERSRVFLWVQCGCKRFERERDIIHWASAPALMADFVAG